MYSIDSDSNKVEKLNKIDWLKLTLGMNFMRNKAKFAMR